VVCTVGGLKPVRDSSDHQGDMSGLSAVSKLSAAMNSLNHPGGRPSGGEMTTQSQHHVEQHQQQQQSADGTSSSMAAARSVCLSVSFTVLHWLSGMSCFQHHFHLGLLTIFNYRPK